MNALRMVWIISRYYSDDMRMGALFKRIGQEIGDRVEAAIDVKVWYDHTVRCMSALLCSASAFQVGSIVEKQAGPHGLGQSLQARYFALNPPAPHCQGLALMTGE